MPDSPVKRNIELLPNRPDTKALNKLLLNMSAAMRKSPRKPSGKELRSRSLASPTAKKFQKDPSQANLNVWLSKSKAIERSKHQKMKEVIPMSPKPLNITTSKLEKTPHKGANKDVGNTTKKSSKPTLLRYNSGDSDELPTFKEKPTRKRFKQTETFKKYGVIVPSFDEIVAAQENFSSYKSQVEEAQTLEEPIFTMPTTPQKCSQSDQLMLDCKQLTLEQITGHFDSNIPFLKDIMNGKKFSDRHRRYFDKKNQLDQLTTKDLTYNTSTIVFTFEQLDHIISLMKTEFDPDDNKTCYFFKVLVPELCFRIFMKVHNMNKREANAYLENRPVD